NAAVAELLSGWAPPRAGLNVQGTVKRPPGAAGRASRAAPLDCWAGGPGQGERSVSPNLVPRLILLAFAGVGALCSRAHTRWWRERDERAGAVGGFGRSGRERGRPGRPRGTTVDVLLWGLSVGAVGVLALGACPR